MPVSKMKSRGNKRPSLRRPSLQHHSLRPPLPPKGAKRNSTAGRGLSGFLQKAASERHIEFSGDAEDLKSVVTFSAEDKEQRHFEKMAQNLSFKNSGVDIAALAIRRYSDSDSEEDCKEDFSSENEEAVAEKKERRGSKKKAETHSSKGSLSNFLNAPAPVLKAAVKSDDVESVVTFSAMEMEREKFSRLCEQRTSGKMEIDLADLILGNTDHSKMAPRRPSKKKNVATIKKRKKPLRTRSLQR